MSSISTLGSCDQYRTQWVDMLCALKLCPLEKIMPDLSKSMRNLALQPLRVLYLHHHSANGHQIGTKLVCHNGLLYIKSHEPLIKWS